MTRSLSSNSKPARWKLLTMGLGHAAHIEAHGPLPQPGEEIEVMPVAEAERLIEAAASDAFCACDGPHRADCTAGRRC